MGSNLNGPESADLLPPRNQMMAAHCTIFLLYGLILGRITSLVSLSTKVLARVNKGLIGSIAFENCVYLFIDGSR